MGEVVKMKGEKKAEKEAVRKYSYYSEDPRVQYLLAGTDHLGKPVYYFKMDITGLRQRMFGPYYRRSSAIAGFDTVLRSALESFCDVQNADTNHGNNGMEHIALPDDLQACR